MFKVLRVIIRTTLIVTLILYGIAMILAQLGCNPEKRNANHWRLIMRWMRWACRFLGLRIHVTGKPSNQITLFTSNHISWHDIVVLQSLVPTGFIGKYEIRGWPLIGWLAYQGNTLFIRRGKRDSFKKTNEAMLRRLTTGQNILLFPEGTTTIGETIKPFRGRLLEPAIKLKLPVQPIAIYYKGSSMSCEQLAFVGEETFFQHILRTLGEKRIDVFVSFGELLPTNEQDDWRILGQRAEKSAIDQLNQLRLN